MRNCVFFLFVFLWVNTASTQEIRLKRTPMLDRLYATKTSISDISEFPNYLNNQNLIVEQRVKRPNRLYFKLVVNDSGLYLLVNAAGFVYKAKNLEKDSICFGAIDSTFYVGYNGSAIKFSYKNVLYSLGGYGFWHMNGYLLHFKSGKDWQIKTLNIEEPVVQKLYSYDPHKGFLYYLSPRYDLQSIGKMVDRELFISLDVKNQLNTELGRMNPRFSSFTGTQLLINVPFLNGVIVEDRFNIFLLSIAQNKVYKLKNQVTIDRVKYGLINAPEGYAYSHKNFLFYSSTQGTPIDSIPLSLNDFELLDEPLYYPLTIFSTFSTAQWIFSTGVFLLIMFGVWGVVFFQPKIVFNRKSQGLVFKKNEVEQRFNFNQEIGFNDFEKSVIKTIVEKNKSLSVNEVNEILGLKKKTPDFQKKIRTEALNRINIKFRHLSGTEFNLIERIRSQEDKRYLLYIITRDVKEVLKYIEE